MFWKAVGEMICAEDMVAILWRALSLAAWSYSQSEIETERQTSRQTHTQGVSFRQTPFKSAANLTRNTSKALKGEMKG